MSGYYLFWVILVLASLWASLGGFLWAHRHGQFRDQQRARYLPLRGELNPLPENKGVAAGSGLYVMAGVFAVGVLGLVATLAVVFLKSIGGAP